MATKTPKTDKPAAAVKPGTAVAVKKATSVVNIAEIQAKLREQAASMGERTTSPGGNKIKIPQGGGKFTLPSGVEVADELQAVILDFRAVHQFYPGKFDPKNIVPPVCFAVGSNPRQMVPTDLSPDRQADSCQGCPNNEFGSDGNGKACKNGRRLALLPLNAAGDDVDSEAEILILDVSPTAIKAFDGYVQKVAQLFQLPPLGVITRIGFDPTVDFGKLTFSDPRPYEGFGDAYARQAEATPLLDALPDFSTLSEVKKPAAKRAGAARR